ncbi:hypothetical protein JX265_011442 [Neoarthrinium moseri]|uniref:Concanavalin A-like lectin/glucanase n=1 Tax=Neoarthrinium moseri TaxID=1658444 RepID=A0A9Q0AJN7_9PEZI|nr:hypothetical protein JX265_011442 [Neoarthrinium moseri]
MKALVSGIFILIRVLLAYADLEVTVVSGTSKGRPILLGSVTLERTQVRRGGNAPPYDVKGKRNSTGASGNWCGGLQHTPSTNKFTGISAYFAAPNLLSRPNTPYPQHAASWIGIDGASCQTALLQAGTTTSLDQNGTQTSNAWLEWIPDAAYTIPSFPLSPGDWMFVNISVLSSTSAQLVLENYSLGNTVTFNLINGTPLCQADTEWIVEDFSTNVGQVPFARFSDIWFEQCQARTTNGSVISIEGATIIALQNTGITPSCIAQEYDDQNFWCSSQG